MSLGDELAALAAPGVPGSTLPGAQRPAPPLAPRGWEPGVRIDPAGPMFVTTTAQTVNVQQDCSAWQAMVEELGLSVPEGWRVRLVEAKYDPVAWTRDSPEQKRATTRPCWRYRFAVEPDPSAELVDYDSLIRDACRRRRTRLPLVDVPERALVVVFADPQIGKVASGGGSLEAARRVGEKLDLLTDHIAGLGHVGRPADVAYWLDAGDGMEGFDNVTSQAFTNDLTITEQVRAYRRLTFEGLDRLAGRFGRVVAATCGSNHTQVRRGKDPVGPASNDWAIEVMSQVAESYARNDEAYGHVSFAFPDRWRDTVALDVAGTTVGLAHGHQAGRLERVPDWWKGQAFGNEPVGHARILVTGHWHHTRVQQLGDGRLWAMAPSLDNGSDWWAQVSGDRSIPGMLVFSVTKDGWDDLRVL